MARKENGEREFNREMGRRIEAARKRRGMKVRELAIAAGISSSRVTAYEGGDYMCSTRTLLRIAAALQVSIMDLIVGEKNSDHLVNACNAAKS